MSIALQNHVKTIITNIFIIVYDYSVGLTYMSTQKLTTVHLAKYHSSPSLNQHSSSMNRRPPARHLPSVSPPILSPVRYIGGTSIIDLSYTCNSRWINVGLTLVHRLRRWTNIDSTSCVRWVHATFRTQDELPTRQTTAVHRESLVALLGGRIARYYARISSNIPLVTPSQVVIITNNQWTVIIWEFSEQVVVTHTSFTLPN